MEVDPVKSKLIIAIESSFFQDHSLQKVIFEEVLNNVLNPDEPLRAAIIDAYFDKVDPEILMGWIDTMYDKVVALLGIDNLEDYQGFVIESSVERNGDMFITLASESPV